MNVRTEKAIKKVIEAGKAGTKLTLDTTVRRNGNVIFRYSDDAGAVVAVFSLNSIIGKRYKRRKK